MNVVLVGNSKTRTVRAYNRENFEFNDNLETPDGKKWILTEDALVGYDNKKLKRLPGHIAYWFAWAGYLGEKSTLFTEN